ncbi:hypothetical protein PSHT_03395, partial [Puccinia striiformis]
MATVTSASGILTLLDEDEIELKTYALEQLDKLVYEFWAEVADGISKIEVMYEDESLPATTRSLAALVASKVYYHLGDINESLQFALGAGERFDVERVGTLGTDGEFVETVVSECIDAYVALFTAHESASSSAEKLAPIQVDKRMSNIVERMFTRCVNAGEYRQALGIALESRRLDIIESIASRHNSKENDLLGYLLEASLTSITRISFRNDLLRLLCYVYLDDPQPASELLNDLLSDEKQTEKRLIAFQICFDLAETATQEFLEVIRTKLVGGNKQQSSSTKAEGDMAVDAGEGSNKWEFHIEQAPRILSGEETIKLYLEFLDRNNHADLLILKQTKDALDARSSLYHNAVSFANAFANAGTTSDKFLRDNLDWLSKASNWSKFSATAGLGVIHRGNLTQGMEILQPYLPSLQGGAGSSFYSEGGSLFALGLINANHGGGTVLEYITSVMKNTSSDIIEHGAALGLGVAGMSSGNEEIYDDLRDVLYHDSAIAGEAAGYAMGLIMLGSGSSKALDEMLQYAHETQHEKIIRGLAVGISLLFYGKEQAADGIIEILTADKASNLVIPSHQDPILRYGGIYTIAMAYAGTGNNKAIRRLLHVAVSDVNDDVRRAAVTSLGFLLFRNPSQVPRVLQSQRTLWGRARTRIACAGTGMEEAISLLEPMTKDTVDYVKQGACIALAMILIQQNEVLNPKASVVRKIFEKIISDKHEDALAKFGATLAQGIIDAGGRNVTMPKFDFNSNARPSLFAYQPATAPPTAEKVEKVATAVLSTTAKVKAREKTKKDRLNTEDMEMSSRTHGSDAMKIDDVVGGDSTKTGAEGTKVENGGTKSTKRRKKMERLISLRISRVTGTQLPYITFPEDSRYVPVRPLLASSATTQKSNQHKIGVMSGSSTIVAHAILSQSDSVATGAGGGILIMRDRKPDLPAEFLEFSSLKNIANPSDPNTNHNLIVEESVDPDRALLDGPIADLPPSFEYNFDS